MKAVEAGDGGAELPCHLARGMMKREVRVSWNRRHAIAIVLCASGAAALAFTLWRYNREGLADMVSRKGAVLQLSYRVRVLAQEEGEYPETLESVQIEGSPLADVGIDPDEIAYCAAGKEPPGGRAVAAFHIQIDISGLWTSGTAAAEDAGNFVLFYEQRPRWYGLFQRGLFVAYAWGNVEFVPSLERVPTEARIGRQVNTGMDGPEQ